MLIFLISIFNLTAINNVTSKLFSLFMLYVFHVNLFADFMERKSRFPSNNLDWSGDGQLKSDSISATLIKIDLPKFLNTSTCLPLAEGGENQNARSPRKMLLSPLLEADDVLELRHFEKNESLTDHS